jgi:hypothetical protein
MGNLAKYLQEALMRRCPEGWKCRPEYKVFSPELECLLGFSPRADVLLSHEHSSRRLWIEFEVSRADPVANHAKFATGHLFQPFGPDVTFVSMVSSHVERGRRNLAAAMISLMRQLGISAFQAALLPSVEPDEIKILNHLSLEELSRRRLPIEREVERAIAVPTAVHTIDKAAVHFAGDPFEVMLNVYQWNEEMNDPRHRLQWGRRTVTYFVFNPYSRLFAPAKFCAYQLVWKRDFCGESHERGPLPNAMTIPVYCELDESCRSFDGHIARRHLEPHLAMSLHARIETDPLPHLFAAWHRDFSDAISIHPRGPIFIIPKKWFANPPAAC